MRIVVAPDSYKGSISAQGVTDAVTRGILAVFPEAEVIGVPIADGGEGTVPALVNATGGELRYKEVRGPVGAPVRAVWGVLGDGKTAVVEMAAASGLPLVPLDKRNPLHTCSYGTGELIKEVLDNGLRRLIVGIGGSGSHDAAQGMISALGAKFLDAHGRVLPPGGGSLINLEDIDLSGLDPRLNETEIMVACDVDNPLYGERGISRKFAAQKGATPEMIELLDKAFERFGNVAARVTGRDMADYPGSGAAGGLGAGFLFFTPAALRPGVGIVLEAVDFAKLMKNTDLVITGEGSTDFQTAYGKAPVGVAKVAAAHGVPVVCLSGGLGKDSDDVLAHGIDATMACVDRPASLQECMERGEEMVQSAAERLCRVVEVGMALGAK